MKSLCTLIGVLVVSAASLPTLCADDALDAGTLQQSFVWSPSAPTGKQVYVVFRKTVELKEQPKSAVLRLFADSRYILWINGTYVERGPCRFDPVGPEYDTIDVTKFLRSGANVLAVLVHHYHDGKPQDNGDSMCGRMMRHAPGLTAELDITDAPAKQGIRTDATWRESSQNRFGPGVFTWTSIPDNIDARRDPGDWTAAGFDDSAWEKAVAVDGKQWGPLRPRHLPLLRETEVEPLCVVQRQDGAAPPHNLADKPAIAKLLPMELTAGSQIIVDAGRFVQAYVEIDMEADADSQLELTYPQTFFAGGNKPDGAQYTGVSRYTARQGRQTFTGGDTFGCKYVTIRCATGKVKLLGVRVVNRLYPFDVVGRFASNDPLLNDIWQIGVNTILTCSEDAYVDCASRERTEWLADAVMVAYPISRLTMAGPGGLLKRGTGSEQANANAARNSGREAPVPLVQQAASVDGKPYWSDPRLFGNLLRHIGQSVLPDGRVKAHHPSTRWDIHGFIEDYACLWIQGLRTWHDNTGDLELVGEMWPTVTSQLKWFLDRRSESGLVQAREFVYFGNPLIYKVCEGATLNAFLAKALADATDLAGLLGNAERQREYEAAGQSIKDAINRHLWDDKTGAYHGGILDGNTTPCTVHAAAMCLYFDIVAADRRKRVEQWFLSNIEKEGALPYQYAFYLEVLARMDSDEADLHAIQLIRKNWTAMAHFETRTAFESFGPGENCHEAGGTPTIYLSRRVLGVQVDGPVADHRLLIEPRLGDLKRAEGIVVTEFGPVSVCWDRSNENGRLSFEIEIPAGVTARVSLPKPAKPAELMIDGQAVKPLSECSRFFTVELGAGKHQGTL